MRLINVPPKMGKTHDPLILNEKMARSEGLEPPTPWFEANVNNNKY